MRHAVCVAVLLVVLLAWASMLNRLAASSPAAGSVWAWTERPGGVLAGLGSDAGLRVVRLWAGGRLVQLHADSLQHAPAVLPGAFVVLRLPLADWQPAGCG